MCVTIYLRQIERGGAREREREKAARLGSLQRLIDLILSPERRRGERNATETKQNKKIEREREKK